MLPKDRCKCQRTRPPPTPKGRQGPPRLAAGHRTRTHRRDIWIRRGDTLNFWPYPTPPRGGDSRRRRSNHPAAEALIWHLSAPGSRPFFLSSKVAAFRLLPTSIPFGADARARKTGSPRRSPSFDGRQIDRPAVQ
jgi:hypothetical protein